MRYFVTAIGTDSGKTVASAILCEALGADYWKPIQAGYPRDTETVESLVNNSKTRFHPESYLLKTAAAPHAAAKQEELEITMNNIKIPDTANKLIIEGAGGCLVPINDYKLMADVIKMVSTEVVVVANLYLGSINHTLLTIEALKSRRLQIKGIIFNGQSNAESERIILHYTSLEPLLHIYPEKEMNREIVKKYAVLLKTDSFNA